MEIYGRKKFELGLLSADKLQEDQMPGTNEKQTKQSQSNKEHAKTTPETKS